MTDTPGVFHFVFGPARPPAFNTPPMSLSEQRRQIIVALINDRFQGNKSAFARHIGRKPGYVSRMVAPPDAPGEHKAIGETLARHIEEMCALPYGTLLHPAPVRAKEIVAALPQSKRRAWVVRIEPTAPLDVWAGQQAKPMGATNEYADTFSDDEHVYLIRITDDSMAPRFMQGELAVVEPGTKTQHGDTVLVRLKDRDGDDKHVPVKNTTLLRRYLGERNGVITLGTFADTTVRYVSREEIAWVHYVAHPIPPHYIRRHTEGTEPRASTN